MHNNRPSEIAFGHASRKVTADRLGFSPKRLDQLVAEGWIPKTDRGEYDQLAAFQGTLSFYRDSARRVNRSSADDELKQIRIQRERRKNDVEERLLVLQEDAQFCIDELVGLVLLEINNIPARFTRDLDLRDKLQETIDEALHKVADGVEKSGAALRADRGDHPPQAPSGDDGDGDDD